MMQGPQRKDGREGDAAIDVAGGVERVMGDHGLFARVLERFGGDYRRAAAAIRAALAAGDTAAAQRLVHTLKGAAGMIEARTLQGEALALEQALGNRDGDCAERLDRLDAELDRVLRELDTMLPPPVAQPGRVSALEPQQATARLARLLNAGDGAALDLVDEAGAVLAAALGEARFGELAEAVNAFDFERALALLKS